MSRMLKPHIEVCGIPGHPKILNKLKNFLTCIIDLIMHFITRQLFTLTVFKKTFLNEIWKVSYLS